MQDLDERLSALTSTIQNVASELKSKDTIGKDRVDYLQAEVTRLDGEYEKLIAEKAQRELEGRLSSLETRIASVPTAKAAAILAGAGAPNNGGRYSVEGGWLKALVDRRNGDPEAAEFVKAVLGTSDATGQAIVPNNFVAALVEQIGKGNIYRSVINYVTGVRGAGVDIPYEVTDITAALKQGAYGSNKDVRDFSFGTATATLYSIAQIADIGNQLLRQSEGAAEATARRRLAESIADAEAEYIINGTGSSQPLGILQAFLAYGDVAALKYALTSETRASALGNGIAKLEALGRTADGIVMHPTDFWEMTTETLGSSGSGGWAMDPVGGATLPRVSVWGVPVFRDRHLPVGTALVGRWAVAEAYIGAEYRIDVSSQAGNRFDQNVTGFRAEEEFGFNAEPYVRTGNFIKVTGL